MKELDLYRKASHSIQRYVIIEKREARKRRVTLAVETKGGHKWELLAGDSSDATETFVTMPDVIMNPTFTTKEKMRQGEWVSADFLRRVEPFKAEFKIEKNSGDVLDSLINVITRGKTDGE